MKLKQKQIPEKKKYECLKCHSITEINGWCPKCGATQTKEIKNEDKV